MKQTLCMIAFSALCTATFADSRAPQMAPAPLHHNGRPLRSIAATTKGHVYALYGESSSNRDWIALSTDTVTRLKMMPFNCVLLSPLRDRYFYVEILPEFEALQSDNYPNYDNWPGSIDDYMIRVGNVRWDNNHPSMRLHVYRLSGEPVTTIELPRSYCGPFGSGRWLNDRLIVLQARTGKIGGNWFSLFVDVETGKKRLVGLRISPQVTPNEGKGVFLFNGILYVDFRPVYPMYGEQLPDFGAKEGWELYRQKYFVQKEKRPFERVDEYPFRSALEYRFTPDGKGLMLIDNRPAGPWRVYTGGRRPEFDKALKVPDNAPPPELILIDLEKIEATKDPKQYARTLAVWPKDKRLDVIRDAKKREYRVYGGEARKVLWRRSFDELAGP